MASSWKKAMHFLGLIEDYDGEYAEVGTSDPIPGPSLGAEAPAAPRPEPSNVRRLSAGGDEPSSSSFAPEPAGPVSTPPPTPRQSSGTVNVIGGPNADPPAQAGPKEADRVHVTSPTTFNDVEEVGSRFRDGLPVLMNLQAASENTAKRLLDFASGLIYGLDGRIERTGDRIFLLTPAGVIVSDAERDRLADRGLLG